MKKQSVVKLLQHYHHDLMNDLQIIHGYLSMDRIDTVKAKADGLITQLNEERKLLNSGATDFILWVINFNSESVNVRLTYEIKVANNSLGIMDRWLVSHCNHVIDWITKYGIETELYEITIRLAEDLDSNSSNIVLSISVNGSFKDQAYAVNNLANINSKPLIKVADKANEITCIFTYSL